MSIVVQYIASRYRDYWGRSPLGGGDYFIVHGPYYNPDDPSGTNVTHVFFSDADTASIQTIVADQNITIDLAEIFLPPNNRSNSSNNTTIKVGSNKTSDDVDVVNNATIIDTPDYGGYPSYDPGRWEEISVDAIREAFSDGGRCLIIAPNSNDAYYANGRTRVTTGSYIQAQVRLTYHYHNSEPEFYNASEEFGSGVRVDLTTYLSSYTHAVTFTIGSQSHTETLAAGVTSCTYTIPMAWISQTPNAASTMLAVQVTTYDGQDIVGDQPTIYTTINVPSQVVPTAGTISFTVNNPLNTPISKHGLVASLSGQEGVYGSTIRTYTLQSEGASSVNQSLTLESINRVPVQGQQYRTITITATVTDSRGRQASTTLNVDVYEWDVPFFSALEYYRCNSAGVRSNDGHYVRIQGTYECYPCGQVNGQNRNAIQPCTIKIVPKAGGSDIDAGQLAQDTAKVVGGGNLSADEEYYLQLTLTDSVTTIVYQYIIYSAAYVIHFKTGGTGVAFGQAATEDRTVRINANWDLIIGNNVDVGSTLADLLSRVAALEGN